MPETRFVRIVCALAALPALMGTRECEPPDPPPPPPEEAECVVGGCSGTVCSDDPDIATTCEWREEYACYRDATCERQADGACGWSVTPELTMCLDRGGPPPPDPCYVAGCSGQLCSDDPDVGSDCEWREEYACYRDATCERQADGACGWTDTAELRMCLDGGGPTPPPDCFVAGCSGTLCTDDPDISTTCEWREEYACYRDATCERQADGACGWTDTPELRMCLDGGGPAAPCYIGGCSSQVCSDDPGVITDCEWREEYACYRTAACERQADGVCSWTETPELAMCLASAGAS